MINSHLAATSRQQLRNRSQVLQASPDSLYQSAVASFLDFIDQHWLFRAELRVLAVRYSRVSQQVSESIAAGRRIAFRSFEEQVAAAAAVLNHIPSCTNDELHVVAVAVSGAPVKGLKNAISICGTHVVEVVVQYLDERTSSVDLLLAILARYKYHIEWFRRSDYLAVSEGSPHREHVLALRLYEYLYEHGIDFEIEPHSASGEADVVVRVPGSQRRLPLDVKQIPQLAQATQIRRTVRQGLVQVATYCTDYLTEFGYLVVFNASGKNLVLGTASSGWSEVDVGQYKVFCIVIDIALHPTTASKRAASDIIVGSAIPNQMQEVVEE